MATGRVNGLMARWPVRGPAADRLLAAALAAVAGLEILLRGDLGIGTASAALLQTIPLAWRRRAPAAVAALVFVGFAIVPGGEGLFNVAVFAVALYGLAAYGSGRAAVLALVVAAVAVAIDAAPDSGSLQAQLENVVFVLAFGAAVWASGRAVRRNRRRASELEELNVELVRGREEQARLAMAEERARIARELHDVVAHSLSVMIVQAGAGERVLDRDPGRAREVFRSIDETGRQALAEMRRMLGLLRSAQDDLQIGPQPQVSEAGTLVDKAREAGLDVTLRVEGEPRALPAGLDLTAYRVIQESLTNVIKHAPGASTDVVVGYLDDALELRITNAPPDGHVSSNGVHGARHGHVGMRERVALYGGELHLARTPAGGYSVRARLPLEESPR